MACKKEYNDVLNNKTKAERYRFRILSAFFQPFLNDSMLKPSYNNAKINVQKLLRSLKKGV